MVDPAVSLWRKGCRRTPRQHRSFDAKKNAQSKIAMQSHELKHARRSVIKVFCTVPTVPSNASNVYYATCSIQFNMHFKTFLVQQCSPLMPCWAVPVWMNLLLQCVDCPKAWAGDFALLCTPIISKIGFTIVGYTVHGTRYTVHRRYTVMSYSKLRYSSCQTFCVHSFHIMNNESARRVRRSGLTIVRVCDEQETVSVTAWLCDTIGLMLAKFRIGHDPPPITNVANAAERDEDSGSGNGRQWRRYSDLVIF